MNGFIQLVGMKHETYLVLRWNGANGFVQNLLKYFMQPFVQTCNFNVGKHIGKLNTITRGIRSKLFRVHLPNALDVKGSFVVALVDFATTRLQSSLVRGGWLFAHHLIVRTFLATARFDNIRIVAPLVKKSLSLFGRPEIRDGRLETELFILFSPLVYSLKYLKSPLKHQALLFFVQQVRSFQFGKLCQRLTRVYFLFHN